jgi:putative transposase
MASGCASFSRINGKTHYLWRAVDQDGNVLDILVQSRRNKHAAKRFFRKLRVRLQYIPRVIITDKLRSYGAAKREILRSVEHRQHKGLNQRDSENTSCGVSASPGHAQRFLSAFGPIFDHFHLKRHRLAARDYRTLVQDRFLVWSQVAGGKVAA